MNIRKTTLPSSADELQIILSFLSTRDQAHACSVSKQLKKGINNYNERVRNELDNKMIELDEKVTRAQMRKIEISDRYRHRKFVWETDWAYRKDQEIEEIQGTKKKFQANVQRIEEKFQKEKSEHFNTLKEQELQALQNAELEEARIEQEVQQEQARLAKNFEHVLNKRIRILESFLLELTEEKKSWRQFLNGRVVQYNSEEFDKTYITLYRMTLVVSAMVGSAYYQYALGLSILPHIPGIIILGVCFMPILMIPCSILALLLTLAVVRLNFPGPERFDTHTLGSFSQKSLRKIKAIQAEFKDTRDPLVAEIKDAGAKTVGEVFSKVSAARDRLYFFRSLASNPEKAQGEEELKEDNSALSPL